MKDSPRIVFFGVDRFSQRSLQALVEAGYNVVLVITKPDVHAGRGLKLYEPAVKSYAKRAGLKVIQPAQLNDKVEQQIINARPDMGIVAAYGKIIPQSTIDLFPLGIVNVHGSLLPRWRGAMPIEAAILHGDKETGISLMQIDAGVDTGPVYAETKLPLSGTETGPELYDQLADIGAKFLAENLGKIASGRLKAHPQDNQKATYAPSIQKSAGIIDWSQPAAEIERQVRAYLAWPGSRTHLLGKEVLITRAHVRRPPFSASIVSGFKIENPDGKPGDLLKLKDEGLAIVTGKDLLVIERLKPAGKNEMSAAEFLRGLKK